MYLKDFLSLCEWLEVCPLDVIKASRNKNEVPELEKLISKEEKKKIQKLQSMIDKIKKNYQLATND